MANYVLSPDAQNSLRDIKQYSIKKFGKDRTKTYLKNMRRRMKDLAENPSRGIIREDLKVGFYSDFIGSHAIYFRIRSSHIDIIDVLHQSMDPSKHIANLLPDQ